MDPKIVSDISDIAADILVVGTRNQIDFLKRYQGLMTGESDPDIRYVSDYTDLLFEATRLEKPNKVVYTGNIEIDYSKIRFDSCFENYVMKYVFDFMGIPESERHRIEFKEHFR
ncbi:MAG: hypothetical protein ACLFUO_03610 [Candidatus Woesearchaeota archaeon]